MSLLTVGINAQIKIAEADFTTATEFTGWTQFADTQTDGKVELRAGEGLAITVGVQTGQYWQPQIIVIPDGSFYLEKDCDYKVVITAKFPTAGTLQINMGNWSTNDQRRFSVKASDDFQTIECEFKDWSVTAEDAHMLFQCGDFKGTTIVKKIEVYRVIKLGGVGYDFEADGIRYIVGANNTVSVISRKTKYSGDVIIPEKVTYNGASYTVTSIFPSAFNECSDLTSVTIPNSVTYIGDEAFLGCIGLTSVAIGSRVTNIGYHAFWFCGPLTSILSLNNTPPTFDGTYVNDNSVLWVPKGCANAYREADGWKDFQNIRELASGDVNLDFEVNQADLDATVDFIMNKDPEGFYESLADLNGDEKVDAADVVKLVTILNIQEGLNMDW